MLLHSGRPRDEDASAEQWRHVRRSNVTVRARRLGVAVRPAPVHAAEYRVGTAVAVHQSGSVQADAGSATPSSASICSNVSTTLEAYRRSRYL
jgi:hypothetical protein